MMNRRDFVMTAAALSAAMGTGLGALVRRRRIAVSAAGADFQSLQGMDVTMVAAERHAIRGVVDDVRTVTTKRRPGAPATEQISLTIAVEGNVEDPGTFRLENDDIKLDDLYFSPVGPAGKNRRLEAVITRIV